MLLHFSHTSQMYGVTTWQYSDVFRCIEKKLRRLKEWINRLLQSEKEI